MSTSVKGMDLTESELIDLIDLLVSQRYGKEGIDFLCAFSEDRTEELFPGSDDILELAQYLDDFDS